MSLEPIQIRAIWLLLSHKTIREAAKRLKVSTRTFSRWFLIPEFQEEMKKRSRAMMEVGFSLSLSGVIDWQESLIKRIRSKDDNVSLRACSIYTPFLCKNLPQTGQAEEGNLLDFIESIKRAPKEKSDI